MDTEITVPASLLRRILALLEETEEWIGEGYDDRSIELQAEIEEVLNRE